jgi:hypothetical protein
VLRRHGWTRPEHLRGADHTVTRATAPGVATGARGRIRATHSPRGVSRDRLVRFLLGELSTGLIFAGGLGLLVHALGGAYLVAAGVVLGVLSAMLAIWILFVGLGFEQRQG